MGPINILLFSDSPCTFKSEIYNIFHVTTQIFRRRVNGVKTLKKNELLFQCGGQAKFMAFSTFWTKYDAKALVTIGPDIKIWTALLSPLPYSIRRRWIHLSKASALSDELLGKCIYNGNELYDIARQVPSSSHWRSSTIADSNPLISVFTSTFNTTINQMRRIIKTMMEQTYNNWEWVIVDDSTNDDLVEFMALLTRGDLRIKCYNFGHSGHIGEVKSRAANMCRGEWLVELDHDDRMHPLLLQSIVDIMRSKPDVGVIYSDFVSVGVDENEVETWLAFSKPTSFGIGGYFARHIRGQWHPVYQTASVNTVTTTDISSMPNHVRSFSRELYHSVGGYNYDLDVADDYELMMRLWMSGAPFVRIAEPMYFQYESIRQKENATEKRRPAIRHLQETVFKSLKSSWAQFADQLESTFIPSKLSFPKRTNVACWDQPDCVLTRFEYTWTNNHLYPPNRSRQCIEDGIQQLPPLSLTDASVLRRLVQSKQLSVVLLVDEKCTTKVFYDQLALLSHLNKTLSVLVLGHPKSVVRSEMVLDKEPKVSSTLLHQFKIWSFGMDSDDLFQNSEEWMNLPWVDVRLRLANYALKIGVRTSHVVYFDTSEEVDDCEKASALSHFCFDLKKDLPPRNDEEEVALCGHVGLEIIEMSGFYHHTALADIYGYWKEGTEHPVALHTSWSALCKQKSPDSSEIEVPKI